MKYVLDTNVISEFTRPKPCYKVIDWFHDYGENSYLNAISVKELYQGVFLLPEGKRKANLKETVDMVLREYKDRTLDFDGFSGYLCAKAYTSARKAGHTMPVEDCMIAAICQRNGATLVTRNVKDFECYDIEVVNPFEYESETLKMLRQREAEREEGTSQR